MCCCHRPSFWFHVFASRCIVKKQLSELQEWLCGSFRIACSNVQTPICFEKYLTCTPVRFHILFCKLVFLKKKLFFSAKLVVSAPQMPDNQQSLVATEADWQNCPFPFVPMFININAVLRSCGKCSKYFGFKIES